jgi:pyruvate dehydrogenase E2 component (dihydrolipoamide acetyltransferase)
MHAARGLSAKHALGGSAQAKKVLTRSSTTTARPGAATRGHRGAVTTPRAEIKEINMPALSSTMTEGKIVSWLMSEGDAIGKGDAVVVVESDKADMDVESFVDGIIAHIAVEDGEMATVGAPIAYVVRGSGGRRRSGASRGSSGPGGSGPGGCGPGPGGCGPGCPGSGCGPGCGFRSHRRDSVREEACEEAQG